MDVARNNGRNQPRLEYCLVDGCVCGVLLMNRQRLLLGFPSLSPRHHHPVVHARWQEFHRGRRAAPIRPATTSEEGAQVLSNPAAPPPRREVHASTSPAPAVVDSRITPARDYPFHLSWLGCPGRPTATFTSVFLCTCIIRPRHCCQLAVRFFFRALWSCRLLSQGPDHAMPRETRKLLWCWLEDERNSERTRVVAFGNSCCWENSSSVVVVGQTWPSGQRSSRCTSKQGQSTSAKLSEWTFVVVTERDKWNDGKFVHKHEQIKPARGGSNPNSPIVCLWLTDWLTTRTTRMSKGQKRAPAERDNPRWAIQSSTAENIQRIASNTDSTNKSATLCSFPVHACGAVAWLVVNVKHEEKTTSPEPSATKQTPAASFLRIRSSFWKDGQDSVDRVTLLLQKAFGCPIRKNEHTLVPSQNKVFEHTLDPKIMVLLN
jgi:hypothetical protein